MATTMNLLLVDGSNMAFRSYAAHADLKASTGEGTGAIYGMLKALYTVKKTLAPKHLAVIWDFGSSDWRTRLYPDYKAQRHIAKEDPDRKAYYDEYKRQLEQIRLGLKILDVPQIQVLGVEADDLIGIATSYAKKDSEVGILSSDKDFFQLLSYQIRIWQPLGHGGGFEKITLGKFVRNYQIDPVYWPDVRALMGDHSDNIPGVMNIGERRAIALVQEYGSVYEILRADPKRNKHVQKVQEDCENVKLYRTLVNIPRAASEQYYTPSTVDSIKAQMRKLSPSTPKIDKATFRDWVFDKEMMTIHRMRDQWFELFGGNNGN